MAGPYDRPYEAEFARALAEEYNLSRDHTILGLLMEGIMPLIQIVYKRTFDSITLQESPELLKLEALEDVFKITIERQLPTESTRVFSKFLFTRIKWSLLDSARNGKSQVFNHWNLCQNPEEDLNHFKSLHDETELRIYNHQFRKLVYETCVADIRYIGKDKEACMYVMGCLTGRIKQEPTSVKFRFRLSYSRADRILEYSSSMIRDAIRDLKQYD